MLSVRLPTRQGLDVRDHRSDWYYGRRYDHNGNESRDTTTITRHSCRIRGGDVGGDRLCPSGDGQSVGTSVCPGNDNLSGVGRDDG